MYTLADGSTSDQYKIGDKFVVQEDEGTFKTGSVIKLIDNDHTFCPEFEVVSGSTTCYGKDDDATAFEEWSNLVKYVEEEDSVESGLIAEDTKQTPFQKAGYTKDTVFKVISNEEGGEFPIGSLVKLYRDDDTDFPAFKLIEDDGDYWFYKFKYELEVVENPKPKGLGTQAGGTHYLEMKMQPVELAYPLGGTPCFTKLAKYLTRNKGERIVNLEKALHVIDLERDIGVLDMYAEVWGNDVEAVNNVRNHICKFTSNLYIYNALWSMYLRDYDSAKFWVDKIIEEEQNGKLEN